MCSFSHSEQVGRAHCGWVLSKISKMSRQNSFKRCLPWCRLQFPHFLLHLAVARDATIQALIVRQLHIMLRGRLIQPCFAGDQRTLLHFTFTSLYFLKDSLYIRGGLYRDVTNATRQVHGYTLNKMWWTGDRNDVVGKAIPFCSCMAEKRCRESCGTRAGSGDFEVDGPCKQKCLVQFSDGLSCY